MKVVNFSEARNNLKAVLDRVVDDAEIIQSSQRVTEKMLSLCCWMPSIA